MTGKSAKKDAECERRAEEAESKASEYLDMARRVQAEFDNFRKRTAKENEEYKKYAAADILTEILTIGDDLDRALSSANEDNELYEGIKAIHCNLMKLLSSRNITEIESTEFDPGLHEALCVCEGGEDGKITEVFQKGYKMGDRVLRYSKVKVTKAKQEGEERCQE